MAKFFFYGTLLDADVRRAVIGRSVPASAILDVSFAGYRVARAQGRSYPILAPEPGATASGVLVHGIADAEAARLFHYEDKGYDPVEVTVTDTRGRPRRGWVFMPGQRLSAMAENWSFAAWERRHKRRTMPLIAAWMGRYAGPRSAPKFRVWRMKRR
jgi:hypothetical protein